MANFRSAIAAQLKAGRFGQETAVPSIVLSEQVLRTFFQISGWPVDFEKSAQPVLQELGFSRIGAVGQAQIVGDVTSFRIAPERILLRSADTTAWDYAKEVADANAISLLDLSHARTVVRLEGPEVKALLARLLSIDLHENEFTVNSFVLTGIHEVPVLLHRLENDAKTPLFDLFVPYTWAASIWHLICHASLPFGYQVT